MIKVLKYGSGNIQAILNIYKRLNTECGVAETPDDVMNASKLILPGVGAFDESMGLLNDSGMRKAADIAVMENQVPVLGICVGMQLMASSSEEGTEEGLGWIPGSVKKFDEKTIHGKPKLPHMGWNDIQPSSHPMFADIDPQRGFYFLHSFYFQCNNSENILATCTYGEPFACAIYRNNVLGFQFHPEKSHSNGIHLFRNFARLN